MSRSVFADFTSHAEPGEILFSAGDPGSTLFVIQSGAVELLAGDGGEQVAVMEKGDFFGEMSLLEGSPRPVTARVLEPAVVIEIGAALFDRMIRSNIEIAVRMLRKLSIRLAATERRLGERREPRPAAPAASPPDHPVAPPAGTGTGESDSAPEVTSPSRMTDGGEIPEPPPGVANDAAGAGAVRLVSPTGETVFELRPGTVHVGRFDPVTGTRPEVDLTLLDLKRSVSRRHATLTIDDGGCRLSEEVGALNGTSVNGEALTAGRPVTLRQGDELAFGSVILRVEAARD